MALSPLQVFWRHHVAATPVGFLSHTVSLDSNHDAFREGRGAHQFSSSVTVAACLQSVRHFMPRDGNVVLIMMMAVAAIVESDAVCEHLQGTHNHALH